MAHVSTSESGSISPKFPSPTPISPIPPPPLCHSISLHFHYFSSLPIISWDSDQEFTVRLDGGRGGARCALCEKLAIFHHH